MTFVITSFTTTHHRNPHHSLRARLLTLHLVHPHRMDRTLLYIVFLTYRVLCETLRHMIHIRLISCYWISQKPAAQANSCEPTVMSDISYSESFDQSTSLGIFCNKNSNYEETVLELEEIDQVSDKFIDLS